jgi:hypothetical protein
MMEQQTKANLEVLENRAETALEKAEQATLTQADAYREFAQTMLQIKQKELYRKAGYPYFATYYKARWEKRTGRSFAAASNAIKRLPALLEFEQAATKVVLENDLPMPSPFTAGLLQREIKDPQERVEAWEHHYHSGRGIGEAGAGLRQSIQEYKGEPTTRDLMTEEDWANLPSGKQSPSEKFAFSIHSERLRLSKLDLEEVAQTIIEEHEPREARHSAETAREIGFTYRRLAEKIEAKLANPVRAVE